MVSLQRRKALGVPMSTTDAECKRMEVSLQCVGTECSVVLSARFMWCCCGCGLRENGGGEFEVRVLGMFSGAVTEILSMVTSRLATVR